MKRLISDIPQNILFQEMLTPLKRTTHTQSVNFPVPQVNSTPAGVLPTCYQSIFGSKEVDNIAMSSPGLDFEDQLPATANNNYQAVFANRPFHQFRQRDDSFVFKQMPSFNRLSFDEVIEINRDQAFEGNVPPPLYKGGQISFRSQNFEYLNNLAAAETTLSGALNNSSQQQQELEVTQSGSTNAQQTSGQITKSQQMMEHSTPQLKSTRNFPLRGFTGINAEGLAAFDPLNLEEFAFRQERMRLSSINEENREEDIATAQEDLNYWGNSDLNAQPKKATFNKATISNISEDYFHEKLRLLEISSPRETKIDANNNDQNPNSFQTGQEIPQQYSNYQGNSVCLNSSVASIRQQDQLNPSLSLNQTYQQPSQNSRAPLQCYGQDFNYAPLQEEPLNDYYECPQPHCIPAIQDFDVQSVASSSSHSVASASTRSRKSRANQMVHKKSGFSSKRNKQMSPTMAAATSHQSIYLKDKHLKEFNASNDTGIVDQDSVPFAPGSSTELLNTNKDITRTVSGFSSARNLGFSSQLIKVNKLSSSNLITRMHSNTSKKGAIQQPLSRQNSNASKATSRDYTSVEEEVSADEEMKCDYPSQEKEKKHFIGPLTAEERREKVLKYLHKKSNKSNMKKFCYKCRKQVAEKRLRIKGRFVTRQQAFEILGITYDELKSNDIIQRLLETHTGFMDGQLGSIGNGNGCFSESGVPQFQLNSLFESEGGRKQIKIRNFQALIDDNYNHNSKNSQGNSSFFSTFRNNNKDLSNNKNAGGEKNGISGGVPEELLRQIQLNLRISTGSSGIFGGSNVTKVLISGGDSMSGLNASQIDDQLKLSLSSLRLEGNYYVQPLFKVERMDPSKKQLTQTGVTVTTQAESCPINLTQ